MKKTENKLPKMAILAEKAFKEAVAEVIDEHRRKGYPIVILRDGKIVHIPPDELPIRKPKSDHSS